MELFPGPTQDARQRVQDCLDCGVVSKARTKHQQHGQRWHHMTYWESLPPTCEQSHQSLSPYKVQIHVLRKRDLLDYRLLMPLLDSPKWGVLDSHKYSRTRYESLPSQRDSNRIETRFSGG